MLSGQDKAKLLLSMLGDRATAVLSLLSPENAMMLTATIGDSPRASQSEMSGLITEVMDRVKRIRSDSAPSFLGSNLEGLELSPETETFGGDVSSDGGLDFSSPFGSDRETELSPAGDPIHGDQGPRLRSPTKVAELLMKEKPQIAAFVISRLDDSFREGIMESFSYEFRDQVRGIKVDKVPLADSVFKRIYDRIVIAVDGEDDDVTPNETGGFGEFSSSEQGVGNLFGF